jgi:hypothetical protein
LKPVFQDFRFVKYFMVVPLKTVIFELRHAQSSPLPLGPK